MFTTQPNRNDCNKIATPPTYNSKIDDGVLGWGGQEIDPARVEALVWGGDGVQLQSGRADGGVEGAPTHHHFVRLEEFVLAPRVVADEW